MQKEALFPLTFFLLDLQLCSSVPGDTPLIIPSYWAL